MFKKLISKITGIDFSFDSLRFELSEDELIADLRYGWGEEPPDEAPVVRLRSGPRTSKAMDAAVIPLRQGTGYASR